MSRATSGVHAGWISAAMLVAGMSAAVAETGSRSLAPVVVTGSRLAGGSLAAGAASTIIDRREIEARQPVDAIELLRQIPGMHIDVAGGRGAVSSLYTRGADPNFTTVLVNGVKLNDPSNSRGGSFDFSTLDLDNIERIEVMRGPFSAIHGSDALAGVVNIVTRRGGARPDREVALSTGGGDFRGGGARRRAARRGSLQPRRRLQR